MTVPMPRCYDCLTEDVAVKLIDEHGFEHWFCAEDWAAEQRLHEAMVTMLDGAVRALNAQDGSRSLDGRTADGH